MSSDYVIEQVGDVTYVRLFQGITLEKINHITDLLGSDYPCQKRLWDMSAFTGDFSRDDLKRYALDRKHKSTHKHWIAIVAPRDLIYGEMRQYQVYRESDPNASIAVFRSSEEALLWLDTVSLA